MVGVMSTHNRQFSWHCASALCFRVYDAPIADDKQVLCKKHWELSGVNCLIVVVKYLNLMVYMIWV